MALGKNKKMIQTAINLNYYIKFKYLQKIAKREKESDFARYIIERYIDDYERQHGEIYIKDNQGM